MKNYFLWLIMTLYTISTFGQETKKVRVKHKGPYYIEHFNVLKSDESIKHGAYKKTSANGRTLIEGRFDNGRKIGTWLFFDFQGYKFREGNYADDKAVGVWKVYNGLKEPKYSFDFATNRIIHYQYAPKEDRAARVIMNGDTIKVDLDHPVLPQIETSIIDEVYRQVRYPAFAKDKAIGGTVIVSVIINVDGSSSTPSLYQSVHPSLDDEALRVVENMDGKWIPAAYQENQ